MNTRKLRKAILTLCSALLLVSLSVGATLAYLTSTDEVVNTFTVGKVAIELDEADTDANGEAIEGADRVTENEYHLLPGHSYVKDPTIWVDEESEDCFLYVTIQNDLEAIEVKADEDFDYETIADQMTALGWVEIGTTGVFYATQEKDGETTNVFTAGESKVVFEGFSITGDVDVTTLEGYATEKTDEGEIADGAKLITVTAYAIQADGFNGDAAAAWNANADTPTAFN